MTGSLKFVSEEEAKSIYIDLVTTDSSLKFVSEEEAMSFIRKVTKLRPPPYEIQRQLSVILTDHDRMNDVYDIMYGNLFTRHAWIKALGAIVTYRPHTEADFKRACDVILENQGNHLSADALDFVKRSKENLQEAIESLDIVRVVNALLNVGTRQQKMTEIKNGL
jgi:hypothetical protein